MFKRITVLLAAIVLLFAAVACGSQSDKYVGTWVQQAKGSQEQSQMPPIVVKKVGDQYAFTSPSGGENLIGVQTDPNASGQITLCGFNLSESTLATPDGDSLQMSVCKQTVKVSVNGDKMTWTQTGESAPYTFMRQAAVSATKDPGAPSTTTPPEPSATESSPTNQPPTVAPVTVATFTGSQDQTTAPFVVGSRWRLSWTVNATDSTPLVVVRDSAGDQVEMIQDIKQGDGSKVIEQACTCTLDISVYGPTTYTFTVTNGG